MNELNIATGFYQSARRTPTAAALHFRGGHYSYAELRAQVEGLRLGLHGDPAAIVGILAHRSPLAMAATLAILAEGKAYVPMSPAFPAVRNAHIASKTHLTTLVVGEECAATLAELLRQPMPPLRIVVLDHAPRVEALVAENSGRCQLIRAVPAEVGRETPLQPPQSEPLAYVLFTSGSTGEPKGVRVLHRNVDAYVRSFLGAYPIAPSDRLSQTFDLTFDVSVHDQFVTWAAGASLVLFDHEAMAAPVAWAARQQVNVWFSVPALAAFLLHSRQLQPGALPNVRLSLFAGEKLTFQTTEVWRQVAPNSRICNLYGPTEATVAVTHFEVPPGFSAGDAWQGGVPIGRPFPTVAAAVLRDDGLPCAAGELGGLWLAGEQVTPGYLADPDRTAERFVQRDGQVWYRTGDLAWQSDAGDLHCGGREDHQVKVMGYRIELGEIEHAACLAAGATFAVTGVAPLRDGIDEIYCVLPRPAEANKKAIRSELRRTLPSYMVPRHLFFLDDVPLSPSGKIDRLTLRQRLLDQTLAAASP